MGELPQSVAGDVAEAPVPDVEQMRLFGLAETLGEDGWLKAFKLEDYAPRRSRRPEMLQQVLFAYTDAV